MRAMWARAACAFRPCPIIAPVGYQSAHFAVSCRSAKHSAIHSSQRTLPLERPADPARHNASHVHRKARILREWMRDKQAIVCLTGAGLSTESGIPDYRGVRGSYFRGHKPVTSPFTMFHFEQSELHSQLPLQHVTPHHRARA